MSGAARETLHQFADLSRDQIETLLAFHREEFRDSFFEFVSPERELAERALIDFEEEALRAEP